MNNEITLGALRKAIKVLLPGIKRLNKDQLDFLTCDDFYDGALSGILSFQDEEYRYEIVTDYKKVVYPRIFALVALTKSESAEEKYWDDLYIQLVRDQPQNVENHRKFFKQQESRKRVDYNDRIVLWYYAED